MCDSDGNYCEPTSAEELFQFLTKRKYQFSWNFFFNLRFDFQSIIKWLPEGTINELYNSHEVIYTAKNYHNEIVDYQISYIPKKVFNVSYYTGDRKTQLCRFYDMFNFLEGSLNSLSKKYLKEEKFDAIDSKRLNVDLEYWKDNRKDIIKYCIQDAILTKKLALYYWNLVKNTMNFIPYYPYSKGAVSQEYFLHKCYIPQVDNFLLNDTWKHILKYAYNAYKGGRFELLKRGYSKEVYLYDIKSAYPYEIANLIDLTPLKRGKWYKCNKDKIDKFKYGYWLCDVNFYHDILSPFVIKLYGLNVYPNGSFKQYLTNNEIVFIRKYFKEVEINPICGYGFIPNSRTPYYPFVDEIKTLYDLKEIEKNKEVKDTYKVFLNSIYGKYWQSIGGKTGKLWQPLWSCEITANTRLKLLKVAMEGNNLKHVIGFSTDSIFSDKELNIPLSNKIGNWDLKFSGTDGIFLMSDIYSIKVNGEDTHKMRGFKIKLSSSDGKKDWITVYNILNKLGESRTKFKYKIVRPKNLGEIMRQNINMQELNVWHEEIKEIDINGDTKRAWDSKFKNGLEPLNNTHLSKPIFYEEK